LILAALSVLITIGRLDQLFADYLYGLQGGAWTWKDMWITEQFFHKGGRSLSILMALISLGGMIASFFSHTLLAHKKALIYLFLAAAGGSLLISLLKSSLAVSCPWEFSRYGGNLDYSDVVTQLFLRNGEGCFPAGHASAGFAWIALYFLGVHYQSKWRWLALAVTLVVGIVLGGVQQLRGAHFISHDLWSLAICWFYSLALYVMFFKISSTPLVQTESICS
jgi:membrane-associated PAP2 superfamily phosphatase